MLFLLLIPAGVALAQNWPAFRGRDANGLGESAAAVSWNADPTEGPVRNILWKTAIPGLSHSSPIVWGKLVCVTTAVSAKGNAPLKVGLYGSGDSADDTAEQAWEVYCLDRRTGQVAWKQTARNGPPAVKRHTKATHANTTLATDGKRMIAFFGSEGLYAYDLEGNLLWRKDLGVLDMGPLPELQWGFASSPIISQDTVIVQADCKTDPFLAIFSLRDGRQIWRTSRKGASERSWATPAVSTLGGRAQIVTNGWPNIAGYDYQTGQELWRLKSEGDIPIPTPVTAHGLIYVTNAHGGLAPLYAIRPEAQGDITPKDGSRANRYIGWSEQRNGAYTQTPLIAGDLLYSCSDRGVLKVYDAKTGRRHYEQRLGGGTSGFSASPVAAGGRVYFTSEDGEVYVIRAGSTFELLATNHLGEIAMATPAVSDSVLFFHTRGHLVAIK